MNLIIDNFLSTFEKLGQTDLINLCNTENGLSFLISNLEIYLENLIENAKTCDYRVYNNLEKMLPNINFNKETDLILNLKKINFLKLASSLLIYVPQKSSFVQFDEYVINNPCIDLELKIEIVYNLITEQLVNNAIFDIFIKFTFSSIQTLFSEKGKFESQQNSKLINMLTLIIYLLLKNESKNEEIIFNLNNLIKNLDIKNENDSYKECILDFLASLICNNDIKEMDKNQIKEFINNKKDINNFLFDSVLEKFNSLVRKKSRFISLQLNIISNTDWELLEILEEKQIHLIKPLFDVQLNENIYDATVFKKKGKFMNSLELILKRMFDHDNIFIRRYTLKYINKTYFESSNFLLSEKFILDFVIPALQDNAIYDKDFDNSLYGFLKKVSFPKMLTKIVELSNVSLFFLYYLTRQLYLIGENNKLEIDEMEKFTISKLFMINQKICSDPSIRVAIQIYILNYLMKNLKDTFESFVLFLSALSFVNLKETNLSSFKLSNKFCKFHQDNDDFGLDLNNETLFKGYLRYCALFIVNQVVKEKDKFFLKQLHYFRSKNVKFSSEVLLKEFVQISVLKIDFKLFNLLLEFFDNYENNEDFFELMLKQNQDTDIQHKIIFVVDKYFLHPHIFYETKLSYFLILMKKNHFKNIKEVFKQLMVGFEFDHKSIICWNVLTEWLNINDHILLNNLTQYFNNQTEKIDNFLSVLVTKTSIDLNRYLIELLGYLLRNELFIYKKSKKNCVILKSFSFYCNLLFDTCLESKKKEYFKETIQIYIRKFLFQDTIFDEIHNYLDIIKIDELENLFEKIFSIETLEVKSILLNHLCDLIKKKPLLIENPNLHKFFLKVLKKSILFTRRNIYLIDILKIEIFSDRNTILPYLNFNLTHNFHKMIRLKALSICLKVDHIFLYKLIKKLIEDEKNLLSTCSMHNFPNSIHHRIQTKIWQFFLFISLYALKCFMNSSSKVWVDLIYFFTLKCLKEQTSNQLSVRLIQQIIIIMFLKGKEFDYLYTSFYDFLKKYIEPEDKSINDRNESPDSSNRVGVLTSFLTIIYHLIKKRPGLKFFPISCLLCCHHYKVRLFSHLILMKNNISLEIPLELNEIVNILPIPRNGANFSKNLTILGNDWFYLLFDIEKDLDLNFIYYVIPKLTNCFEDDYIELNLLRDELYFMDFSLGTENSNLMIAPKSSLFSKTASDSFYKNNLYDKNVANFQKKYVGPTMSFGDFKPTFLNNLIICASLIDRAPNLGGLCRTGEVFGIKKLILSKSSFLKDKEFLQLSVSSHKWMNIEEINSHQLVDYMRNIKKNENYSLIGIEQSTKSINLKEFKFPEKSFILLGNEKEGLPIELLQMMDYCIEIPQVGFIRSLNVHVTGAIIIWEYFKQFT